MLGSVHMHWHKQNAIKNHWLQKKMLTGAWSPRTRGTHALCHASAGALICVRCAHVHTCTKKVLATRLRFFMEVFVSTTRVDDCTARTMTLCV